MAGDSVAQFRQAIGAAISLFVIRAAGRFAEFQRINMIFKGLVVVMAIVVVIVIVVIVIAIATGVVTVTAVVAAVTVTVTRTFNMLNIPSESS